MSVQYFKKNTTDTTYVLTKLVKMSPKRDEKLKSLQQEQQSSMQLDFSDGFDDLLKDKNFFAAREGPFGLTALEV